MNATGEGRVLFTLDEVEKRRPLGLCLQARGRVPGAPSRAPTTRGRVYAPALWWRARKRVAVGGATTNSQAKAVADLIKIMLVEREAAEDGRR